MTRDSALDLRRRVLLYGDAPLRRNNERDAARLPYRERRLRVLPDEWPLNGDGIRRQPFNNFDELRPEMQQPKFKSILGLEADNAALDKIVGTAIAPNVKRAISGHARSGINAEDTRHRLTLP